MSFLHDVIKIQFINIGYLPNYPYHLISDEEMVRAFYNKEAYVEGSSVSCFFKDYYYYPEEWVKYADLKTGYDSLKDYIATSVADYLDPDKKTPLPDWIYSYMLMRPITFESGELDIVYLHDLLASRYGLAHEDELKVTGEYLFTEEMANLCYLTSLEWIQRNHSKNYDRPATMFGETHVTKSLRLAQASIYIAGEDEG